MILDVALGIILAGILIYVGALLLAAIMLPFSVLASIFKGDPPRAAPTEEQREQLEKLARIRRGEPELKVTIREVPLPQ